MLLALCLQIHRFSVRLLPASELEGESEQTPDGFPLVGRAVVAGLVFELRCLLPSAGREAAAACSYGCLTVRTA